MFKFADRVPAKRQRRSVAICRTDCSQPHNPRQAGGVLRNGGVLLALHRMPNVSKSPSCSFYHAGRLVRNGESAHNR